jgi:hypothetical protein
MQESFHLVALDMAIDPKHTYTLYGVLSANNKNLFDTFALINLVLFFFLLFQVGALDHLFWSSPPP